MAFRNAKLRGNEAFARYDGSEHALSDLMETGFFPARSGLNLHDDVTLFAADGAARVYVSGFTVAGEPVLSAYQDVASPDTSAPRRGRPPKVADAA